MLGRSDYSQVWLTNVTVSADPGWHHFVIPIDPTSPALQTSEGSFSKMSAPAFNGTATFWVDNVNLLARSVEAPPPTLDVSRNITPGLNLYASNPNDQYQRQNIRLINSLGTSWVNAADPVSYSVGIADYPTQANFQTHIMLVPGTPGNESSPDWNSPTSSSSTFITTRTVPVMRRSATKPMRQMVMPCITMALATRAPLAVPQSEAPGQCHSIRTPT